MEEWKNLFGFEKFYRISSHGNLYSIRSKKLRAKSKYENKYNRIIICKDGERYTVSLHRLVADAFLPKIEGKNYVNHKNGIKSDNRVSNLEWCTMAENNKHKFDSGLHPKYTKRHMDQFYETCKKRRKFSLEKAKEIISLYKSGISIFKLAKENGVREYTIRLLVKGKTYQELSR